MKYLLPLLLISLSAHSATTKRYDCEAIVPCHANEDCVSPAVRITLTDGVYESAEDIGYAADLTINSHSTVDHTLSLSGTDVFGIYFMQLNLKKITNSKKPAGFMVMSYGDNYDVYCEQSKPIIR